MTPNWSKNGCTEKSNTLTKIDKCNYLPLSLESFIKLSLLRMKIMVKMQNKRNYSPIVTMT